MKLVGLDYFGLDINNPIILKLNYFISKFYLENIWYMITLYINVYIVVSITCNDKSKKLKKYILACLPIIVLFQSIKGKIGLIGFVTDILYMLILSLVYNKIIKQKTNKSNIANYTIITILCFLIQMFSMIIRNKELINVGNGFCVNAILSLDYFSSIIIIQKLYFMKGGKNLCQVVVSSGLQKLTNFKMLLKRLLKNLLKRNKNSNKTKLEINTYRIYLFLYILWNIFTLVIILFIASLNNTVEECIFIIFAFWVTKRVFGKAFHLKNVFHCFIVSNLTYYFLNRITAPLGISILIPIMLGVGLSYFTSKLVKKTYKPLYKGMPKEVFEETILKVVDKDSDKYKICYDYFINKQSALYLSGKYNYTEAGIRKIKDRVNNKIKELK
jgi:hypothetical protein